MTDYAMTTKECENIGKAMAREYYKLCCEKGLPENDLVTSDEACKILGKDKTYLYNHAREIPHYRGWYSRSALMAYMRR